MGVGLRTTGLSCLLARTVGVVYSAYISIGAAALRSRSVKVMCVASQLLHAQRRGADSAGNTRPQPSTPRLPLLRRGSHNGQHSTAAGCWQHRNWPRKGCACATGCRQFVRFRDRNQRPMSLTQEPRSWKFLFQIQRRQKYAYAQPAAPR